MTVRSSLILAAIFPTTLFATACSTVVAVLAAKFLARLCRKSAPAPGDAAAAVDPTLDPPGAEPPEAPPAPYPAWVSALALAGVLALIPLTVFFGKALSPWIMPGLMAGFLVFGALRRVRVYEVYVEGAKEGFQVALRIIPYLVAILVAVAMLRASGALEAMVGWLGPWTSKAGLPAEALPMALMRPLSGSGAFAVLASIINDPAIGPDSYTGVLVSTLQGCTETTFYVMAVYFGAAQVRYYRSKDFDAPYDEAARARLAGMRGQLSTRMGTALRHAGHFLRARRCAHKLVLLLTDGEPHDIDVHDKQYLLFDTKRAVEDLRRVGVATFCLSLDRNADDYVTRIFGGRNYLVLDHLRRLPEKLPALYLRLTT